MVSPHALPSRPLGERDGGGGGGGSLQPGNMLFGMKLGLGMRLGKNMGRADCVAVHRAHHTQGSLCCIAT